MLKKNKIQKLSFYIKKIFFDILKKNDLLKYTFLNRNLAVFFIIMVNLISSGQDSNFTIPDSLSNKSFDNLYDQFYDHMNIENEDAKIYALTYLHKGIMNKSNYRITWGHYLLSVFYGLESDKWLTHIDKAIEASKEINDRDFPTLLFINKAVMQAEKGEFNEAINNYLEGIKYSKKTGSNHYQYMIKHNISLLKRKLGKYNEAKLLLNECLAYEEQKNNRSYEDSISYLVTLSELITTHRYNKEIDSFTKLNEKGFSLSRNYRIHNLFKINDGIKDYYEGNYHNSIKKISDAIPYFFVEENKYFYENYNLIDAYWYLGTAYEELSNYKKSIQYYNKVDSIIAETNYYIPQNRLVYTKLINHYKSINDKKLQLKYINRLLYVDSILNKDYKLINNKIIKDYETPELLREKEILIKSMSNQNSTYKSFIVGLLIVLTIVSLLFIYQYRKKKLYHLRFENLLKKKNSILIEKKDYTNISTTTSNDIGIPPELVKTILNKLHKFEENLDFTKQNITTNTLAKEFNTNSKYLSKIINTHRQKSFTQYINDLRVEYVMKKLRIDSKFQNYTIKAIAKEIGFSNTQSFSTYFYKKNGIYPSFFIKELKNIKNSK
ncbi:helix-turn-helix domain-containing protein [Aquimarina sediminis]|uniref:helix-turn-helix domain-containing protein n=1 Tax=Aquimarina sediminis TaxID=2070536 RepID=UPI000CA04E59|nr:helix-turn-helix domain-containing protein [Aquimarina sediminis]